MSAKQTWQLKRRERHYELSLTFFPFSEWKKVQIPNLKLKNFDLGIKVMYNNEGRVNPLCAETEHPPYGCCNDVSDLA